MASHLISSRPPLLSDVSRSSEAELRALVKALNDKPKNHTAHDSIESIGAVRCYRYALGRRCRAPCGSRYDAAFPFRFGLSHIRYIAK